MSNDTNLKDEEENFDNVCEVSTPDFLLAKKNLSLQNDAEINMKIEQLYDEVKIKDGCLPEFMQAFEEVLYQLKPVFLIYPQYINTLRIIAEPERCFIFRVPWLDDKGVQNINRGYRVQYSSTLGPYKGGLRFHPSVNLSIIKFLGFEQIFKNSLTSLNLGGAKGGADFDPKGKSDGEIQRFCQSFMTSLYKYIGWNVDVPAGDIGVGSKEIGYLYGQYKRITNNYESVITGKNIKWGGSELRPEATGYGVVYMAKQIADYIRLNFEGKSCMISGSGNVAIYCAEKCINIGLKVLTLSDSNGYIYEENGINTEQLKYIMNLKKNRNNKLKLYSDFSNTVIFKEKKSVWESDEVKNVDIVFPCATENEIQKNHALFLHKKNCKIIVEGANMPCTKEAVQIFQQNNIIFCPGKAANAGGVAVSGLEMRQNACREIWNKSKVDFELQLIIKNIFSKITKYASMYTDDPLNLSAGANIAGFLTVADAVIEQGCV